MKSLLISILCVSCSMATQADESEPYFIAGFSLLNDEALAAPDNTEVSSNFVPELSLGVAFDYQVADNWLLTNDLSLRYAQANLNVPSQLNPSEIVKPSSFSNTGLWATSTIKYQELVANVSPFASVSVGKVYTQGSEIEHEWNTGLQAKVGLEFDIGSSNTISLAVGTSDYD